MSSKKSTQKPKFPGSKIGQKQTSIKSMLSSQTAKVGPAETSNMAQTGAETLKRHNGEASSSKVSKSDLGPSASMKKRQKVSKPSQDPRSKTFVRNDTMKTVRRKRKDQSEDAVIVVASPDKRSHPHSQSSDTSFFSSPSRSRRRSSSFIPDTPVKYRPRKAASSITIIDRSCRHVSPHLSDEEISITQNITDSMTDMTQDAMRRLERGDRNAELYLRERELRDEIRELEQKERDELNYRSAEYGQDKTYLEVQDTQREDMTKVDKDAESCRSSVSSSAMQPLIFLIPVLGFLRRTVVQSAGLLFSSTDELEQAKSVKAPMVPRNIASSADEVKAVLNFENDSNSQLDSQVPSSFCAETQYPDVLSEIIPESPKTLRPARVLAPETQKDLALPTGRKTRRTVTFDVESSADESFPSEDSLLPPGADTQHFLDIVSSATPEKAASKLCPLDTDLSIVPSSQTQIIPMFSSSPLTSLTSSSPTPSTPRASSANDMIVPSSTASDKEWRPSQTPSSPTSTIAKTSSKGQIRMSSSHLDHQTHESIQHPLTTKLLPNVSKSMATSNGHFSLIDSDLFTTHVVKKAAKSNKNRNLPFSSQVRNQDIRNFIPKAEVVRLADNHFDDQMLTDEEEIAAGLVIPSSQSKRKGLPKPSPSSTFSTILASKRSETNGSWRGKRTSQTKPSNQPTGSTMKAAGASRRQVNVVQPESVDENALIIPHSSDSVHESWMHGESFDFCVAPLLKNS